MGDGAMLKRAGDIIVAVAALTLLAPLMLLIAIAVRLRMGAPILFRQERPGLNGQPFTLLKFRTMADGDGPDVDRLTGLGRFLRRSSLDELPEFWNILTGEMSLVGPRPLLMHYLPLYSPEQARRHEVKPGLTGWAQVNGRNALGWDEKFAADVWYVDHQSLGLDLEIIARTIVLILSGEGVSAAGEATMSPFEGSDR